MSRRRYRTSQSSGPRPPRAFTIARAQEAGFWHRGVTRVYRGNAQLLQVDGGPGLIRAAPLWTAGAGKVGSKSRAKRAPDLVSRMPESISPREAAIRAGLVMHVASSARQLKAVGRGPMAGPWRAFWYFYGSAPAPDLATTVRGFSVRCSAGFAGEIKVDIVLSVPIGVRRRVNAVGRGGGPRWFWSFYLKGEKVRAPDLRRFTKETPCP